MSKKLKGTRAFSSRRSAGLLLPVSAFASAVAEAMPALPGRWLVCGYRLRVSLFYLRAARNCSLSTRLCLRSSLPPFGVRPWAALLPSLVLLSACFLYYAFFRCFLRFSFLPPGHCRAGVLCPPSRRFPPRFRPFRGGPLRLRRPLPLPSPRPRRGSGPGFSVVLAGPWGRLGAVAPFPPRSPSSFPRSLVRRLSLLASGAFVGCARPLPLPGAGAGPSACVRVLTAFCSGSTPPPCRPHPRNVNAKTASRARGALQSPKKKRA